MSWPAPSWFGASGSNPNHDGPTADYGRLLMTRIEYGGDNLTAPSAAGAGGGTLTLGDVNDFDETASQTLPRYLRLQYEDGTWTPPVAYWGVIDGGDIDDGSGGQDGGTVQIEAVLPPTGGWPIGTRVEPYDQLRAASIPTYIADVGIDGVDTTVPAVITHALIDLLSPDGSGVRQFAGESVRIERDPARFGADGWYLTEVTDVAPRRNAKFLDPATMPTPEPPSSPNQSPTPVMIGNVRTLLGTIAAAPTATSYDIYLSDTNTAAPSPEYKVLTTTATQFQLAEVPGILAIRAGEGTSGTAQFDYSLQYETTYYVAVVALNSSGAAAPSPWVAVQLRQVDTEDISAAYAYLGDVTADRIVGGTFRSTMTWAGLLTTRGDAFSPGGEMDASSLRGFGTPEVAGQPAPLQVEIPFDGRPASFAGDVAARKLTAYQGTDLYGDANNVKADGGLYLESGAGGAVAGPQISQSVPSIPITPAQHTRANGDTYTFGAAQCSGWHWHAGWGGWITAQNVNGGTILWVVNKQGTVSSLGWFDSWQAISGIVYPDNSRYAWLLRLQSTNDLIYLNTRGTSGVSQNLLYQRENTAIYPAIGLGSDGDVRVAEVVPGGGGQLRVHRYAIQDNAPAVKLSTTTTQSGLWIAAQPPSSISVGAFDFGDGFLHHVAPPKNSVTPIKVFGNATTAENPELSWNPPVGMVGVAMDALPGTAGTGWWGFGSDNRLYAFTNNTWSSGTDRHVIAVTMATSTAESQVGAKVAFNLQKRRVVNVTGPQLVSPATRQGIYLWRGASGLPTDSQMVRQGYTGNAGRTYQITTPIYSGSAPGGAPTASPYPTSAPAWMRSQKADGGGSIVAVNGDGSWRLGQLSGTADGKLIGTNNALVAMTHNGTSGTAQYKAIAIGGATQVYVIINVAGFSVANATTQTLVTAANGIPAGLRPPAAAVSPCRVVAGGNVGSCIVGTDGSIQVSQQTGAATGLCSVTFSYVV